MYPPTIAIDIMLKKNNALLLDNIKVRTGLISSTPEIRGTAQYANNTQTGTNNTADTFTTLVFNMSNLSLQVYNLIYLYRELLTILESLYIRDLKQLPF